MLWHSGNEGASEKAVLSKAPKKMPPVKIENN
jgi:hypothetical protein